MPMPSALARVYIRVHHRKIAAVRKKPAISHQPPSFRGGSDRPYFGAGGSSERNGSILMKRSRFQSTCASMFRPMISIAMKPQTREAIPYPPR